MKAKLLAAVIAVTLALTAGTFYMYSGSAAGTEKTALVTDPLINTETLRKRLSDKDNIDNIDIVDVRETDEFAVGHIPGARNIPLGTLGYRLKEIPHDKEIILVCRSGNRSGLALQVLQSAGFSNARNLVGGMLEWNGEVVHP